MKLFYILIAATMLTGCSQEEKPKEYSLDVKCRCACPQQEETIEQKKTHIPEILIA